MNAKILVIEDDVPTRKGLIVRLEASRYKMVWAQDAISGIDMTVREKPDLILLDLGLPGGDGYLVMKRLRSLSCAVPVIVLSGRDASLSRDQSLRAGASAFLEKPADTAELLDIIQKTLAGL